MESKKKVSYVLHDIAIGGVEVALLSAIPALHQKFQLRVIVLGKVDKKLITHLTKEQREVFTEVSYPTYQYPFVMSRIVRQILLNEPDIVICSLWRGALSGIFAKLVRRNIRLYAFIHNTGFPHFLAKFSNKMAVSLADVVLSDSIATKIYVQNEFKPKAEVRIVSFITRPTQDWRNPPAPDIQKPVRFVFLGRINKVKNLPAAIELIRFLRSRSVPAMLDIFGKNDDGHEDQLKTLIQELNLNQSVHFKGEITGDQKWSVFSSYHFHIQLSFSEGMAMSVTEAMQNGLVCVVSPVGEIANYAEDMKSAIFIDVFNKKNQEADFEKVLTAIQKTTLYSLISKNANQHFQGKKIYSDSLIEHLEASTDSSS